MPDIAWAQTITEASYALFYRIARDKKPHTIGETLVKPCLLECTKIILGDTAAQKIADLSLSDRTVKSRIDDMSADIKRQVIEKIKSSPMFAIQLDESTDVASILQLTVFARYVHRETIDEEFLFCSPLTETTTAANVMNLISDFFSKEHLDWGKRIRVCTDGAPAMLGCCAEFAQLVKEKIPLEVEGFHQCLAYLVDIFGLINEVNTKMQGRDRNVLSVTDSINAFKGKLKLCVERLATGNTDYLVDRCSDGPLLATSLNHLKLNDLHLPDAYLLPQIDDSLNALLGKLGFSTLDLVCGYWQLFMVSDIQTKLAFLAYPAFECERLWYYPLP
ncbi:protein FAM200C-like [Watersipora subatra]|uniref:protein FAM200C-like n=1 Tax=Watersipora subatra TaxID=2589382 RepID=UPI00355C0159